MRNAMTATLLTATLVCGSASAQVPCPNCGAVRYVVSSRPVVAAPRTVVVTPTNPSRYSPYVAPARPRYGFFNRPDAGGAFVPPPPIPMVHLPEPVIPHPQ